MRIRRIVRLLLRVMESVPGANRGPPARAARVGWWMRPGLDSRAARDRQDYNPVLTTPGTDLITHETELSHNPNAPGLFFDILLRYFDLDDNCLKVNKRRLSLLQE